MIFLYLLLIFGIQAETRCRLEAKDKARRKIQVCKNKTKGIENFYLLVKIFFCNFHTSFTIFFSFVLSY